ncbi:MAG: hypothetical protein CVU55_04170 [Deltaproteobacteria bacterium HGW-Deltaproteobacteria-13]|jgi:hypothetical protein|nr:MAG: hypothetical protein CVU55_04170 [Deltaproteobacteria bacterium HGW-Deltaproteobacteria-13]
MKRFKVQACLAFITFILSVVLITGCGSGGWGTSNPDSTAPTVTAVVPLDDAGNVTIKTKIITATFSEAMDPATLTTASFTLECPAGVSTATGVVTYDEVGKLATLTLPSTPDLPPTTLCTATITTAAKDLAGNALANDFVWTFTTDNTMKTFAVLAGSTVTNTGPTNVTGNLGVSPGMAVTGFPPGVVVTPGTIHAGDAVAAQAQSDLTSAYNLYLGTPCTVDLTGQNLGGLTLTSGVYCFTTSAQLTGNLTLDAQSNPNALFIFKIGSTLTTASNSSVVFINSVSSVQSDNLFWQVGASATLGTTTSFKGNIMALSSITLNTGAVIEGRALARNGAVTLDTNTITLPAP